MGRGSSEISWFKCGNKKMVGVVDKIFMIVIIQITTNKVRICN